MASRLGVFLLILAVALPLSSESPEQWIIWNVGQGQWVSFVTAQGCFHFDTGGEFAPWKSLMEHCRERKNILSFSHWDWDHVAFAQKTLRFLPDSCVLLKPFGQSSKRKRKLFALLPACEKKLSFSYWEPTEGRTANDLSRVFFWKGLLIPGDSPIEKEKIWAHQIGKIQETRILVLGHHGSRTSTGRDLLQRLPHLKVTVASARLSRYGHPHNEVRRRLEERRIPLLTTEDWGHLHFYN